MDFEKTNCNLCGSDTSEFMFLKEARGVNFNVVRCKQCKFIFMNPMITKEGLKKIYTDNYYENFDLSRKPEANEKLYHTINTATFKYITKITGIHDGNLLDVGCALGYFLDSVRRTRTGWRLFGCDISKESITLGRKKLNLDLRVGEIKDCKYPDNFFDIVTMREVIEHIRDPVEALREINRILKKGGFIVITTGNLDALIPRIRGKKNFYYDSVHVSYFSIKTIKDALRSSGFKVFRIDPYFYTQRAVLSEEGFNIRDWLTLLKLKALDIFRIGNFSIMGGMLVFAQKL